MQLNELLGIKKHRTANYHDFLRRVLPPNTELFSGSFGVVAINPAWPYVIKFWQRDSCYIDFVDFTLANPNIHYPRFVKKIVKVPAPFRRLRGSGDHLYAIRIEKLTPCTGSFAKFVFAHLFETPSYIHKLVKGMSEERAQLGRAWTRVMPDGSQRKISIIELWHAYPWLKTLSYAWYDLVTHKMDCATDLTVNNFMQREDGTVVITDPYWEGDPGPLADYYAHDDEDKVLTSVDYVDGGEHAPETGREAEASLPSSHAGMQAKR